MGHGPLSGQPPFRPSVREHGVCLASALSSLLSLCCPSGGAQHGGAAGRVAGGRAAPGTARSGSPWAAVRAGLWGCWSEGRLGGDGSCAEGLAAGAGIELPQFLPLVTADVWFHAPLNQNVGGLG